MANIMESTLTITPHLQENYLHVHVKGTGSYESALMLWKSVAQACEKHQCYNVLGEQFLVDTVTTSEAFDHPTIFKQAGISLKHRIAWVDKNPRTRDTTEFICNVITNRSIGSVRLFNDVDSAKRWLLGAPDNTL